MARHRPTRATAEEHAAVNADVLFWIAAPRWWRRAWQPRLPRAARVLAARPGRNLPPPRQARAVCRNPAASRRRGAGRRNHRQPRRGARPGRPARRGLASRWHYSIHESLAAAVASRRWRMGLMLVDRSHLGAVGRRPAVRRRLSVLHLAAVAAAGRGDAAAVGGRPAARRAAAPRRRAASTRRSTRRRSKKKSARSSARAIAKGCSKTRPAK